MIYREELQKMQRYHQTTSLKFPQTFQFSSNKKCLNMLHALINLHLSDTPQRFHFVFGFHILLYAWPFINAVTEI